jgi:phenylalanyl-tRNA synthetase alpha chain
MVEFSQITATSYILSEEGAGIAEKGSHEYRVWEILPVKGQGEAVSVPELKVSVRWVECE